ncbi:MAG: hypothetical protein NTU98_08845 [Bacteroidetes bacterium]|nr:hypothetical protein [Bacteroidota bacterium]
MKKIFILFGTLSMFAILLLTSCESTVNVTGWKNPEIKMQVSKIVVMPLFEKLQYLKPFEQSMVTYFNSKGLPSIGSLEFLNPSKKYPIDEIKHRCDSLGADAILLFLYQGTDKTESYTPPTTYYTGGYGGYGGYWGGGYWGGGYYGAGYAETTVTTGGYWETTSVINLTAKLFVKGHPDPLWTAEVAVQDPKYVDIAAHIIGQEIYSHWKNDGLIKLKQK